MRASTFTANNKLIIEMAFEERDWSKTSLPAIATTLHYLATKPKALQKTSIVFDFTNTYWVEVPTLLAVATLASEASRIATVRFRFGVTSLTAPTSNFPQPNEYAKKLKFLSFLRSMGFFLSLPETVIIELHDTVHSESERNQPESHSPKAFAKLLNRVPIQPFIQAITLVPLKVNHTASFQHDSETRLLNHTKLRDQLKHIGDNAALIMSSAGLQTGTIRRQRILLSIDKILQESLANIIEHAYPGKRGGYFAFFARVRNPNSTFKDEFREGLYPSSDEFDLSKDAHWTEIYVCDLGQGLETQLEPWLVAEEAKSPRNKKLIKELKKANNSQNKFLFASRLLFDHSLSRHADRNFSRSPQTGFQDLKRVLSDVGYVDISNSQAVTRRRFHNGSKKETQTNRDSFSESKTPRLQSNQDERRLLSQFETEKTELRTNAGTHLVFRTQFYSELPLGSQPGFRRIGRKQATRALASYSQDADTPNNVVSFDKRFEASSRPSKEDFSTLLNASKKLRVGSRILIFVRLSRNPYKNDVNEWLALLGKKEYGPAFQKLIKERRLEINLVFVDVLPVYAGWLTERIRSYADSSWILQSGFKQVGVFTNLLDFVVFENTGAGFRFSRRATTAHADTIQFVVSELRRMDSAGFWKSYRNHPVEEFYLNQEVEWITTRRRVGETFSNEFPSIWGYLDFATALQCLERYSVCERALLRFMAVLYNLNADEGTKPTTEQMYLPTMVSSDTMTQRLAASVASLFEEISAIDGRSQLVLSSVVVTGQTENRALIQKTKSDNPDLEVQVCFFDRAADAPKGKPLRYSLMRWTPPDRRTHVSTSSQKRIFRTPEVSPKGSMDIRIPHVTTKNGRRVENYQRNRTETYADLELLGALRFGHVEKSNRHELIDLNLNSLVPLIISTSHPSWNWLVSAFFDQKSDCDKAVIVVYPNQPHAERIIQELKRRESHKLPADRVSFISAPFLKQIRTEPIIFGPRLELRLAELIQGMSGDPTQGNPNYSKVVVRVFDTGVVSGRTMKALQQQVENVCESRQSTRSVSSESVEIESISLVDRSGSPIYGSLLEKFSRNNKRFWRWDVPSLNDNGACRVCLAKKRARELEKVSEAFVGPRYVSDILPTLPSLAHEQFQGGPYDHPERGMWDGSLAEINLSHLPTDLQQVIFGYYGSEPNVIYLTSPLQYVATFVELTRLLHRSDIALNRAMELLARGGPRDANLDCLIILILSSHLLLFYDSFDLFEKVNYAVELFGCLVDFEAEWGEGSIRTAANSYGMLALYSIDDDVLAVLKTAPYFCHWLALKRISNPYIRAYIHHVSKNDVAFPIATDIGAKKTEAWDFNVFILRHSPSIVVSKIMDLVGDQRVWHQSPISQRLSESGVTQKQVQGHFRELVRLIGEAGELGVLNCHGDVLGALKAQAKLGSDRPLETSEKDALREALTGGPGSLRRTLFDSILHLGPPDQEYTSWSGRRSSKRLLTLFLSRNGSLASFLHQLNCALKNDTNRTEVVELFDYIGLGASTDDLPFEKNVSLAPSFAGKTVVENALLNSRHGSERISDPSVDGVTESNKKFVWVWLSREEESLVFNVANSCHFDPGVPHLFQDRFPEFAAEGNKVVMDYDKKNRTMTTRIHFNTLVRR